MEFFPCNGYFPLRAHIDTLFHKRNLPIPSLLMGGFFKSFQSCNVSGSMIQFRFFLNVLYAATNFLHEFPVCKNGRRFFA